MTVLERSELEASPLADLHAIANQIGVDGFRRLRKAELIDAILGVKTPAEAPAPDGPAGEQETATEAPAPVRQPPEPELPQAQEEPAPVEEQAPAQEPAGEQELDRGYGAPARRRRFGRLRRVVTGREEDEHSAEDSETTRPPDSSSEETALASAPGEPELPQPDSAPAAEDASAEPAGDARSQTGARRRGSARAGTRGSGAAPRPPGSQRDSSSEDLVEGVVELLSGGSAFLRLDPSRGSDDVYVSAAQVRRCEIVGGDRVSGPVRQPRRSERYPSLVRVETVNGVPASRGAVGPRYEEQPAAFPNELLRLDSGDVTLAAIEQLAPIGLGSRAIIVGRTRSGKTETLRRLVGTLTGREGLELSLVLVGVRPEEASEWAAGELAPATVLSLGAAQEAQDQAVEQAIERGKRIAARGGNALVAIDSLDSLAPAVARKAMAAARNLAQAGSLTVIATATVPLGGETTVIALDAALLAAGRLPALDLAGSGTLKPELLVGEDGARRMREQRARALGR